MKNQSSKLSDMEIEGFIEWFSKRYILKKRVNALICFFIAICGTTAVLYSRFIFHNALLDRLRYMTFWGRIFTSAVSLIFGVVCILEARRETEVTYKPVYFLRLSSATTESVIFAVVMFGLTPLVPDEPDINLSEFYICKSHIRRRKTQRRILSCELRCPRFLLLKPQEMLHPH